VLKQDVCSEGNYGVTACGCSGDASLALALLASVFTGELKIS
jgi:hypothetical protein